MDKSRRVLILASKVLQNISNNFLSKEKSGNVAQLNQFVDTQAPILVSFFSRLTEEVGLLSRDCCASNFMNFQVQEEPHTLNQGRFLLQQTRQRMILYLKSYILDLGRSLITSQTPVREAKRMGHYSKEFSGG